MVQSCCLCASSNVGLTQLKSLKSISDRLYKCIISLAVLQRSAVTAQTKKKCVQAQTGVRPRTLAVWPGGSRGAWQISWTVHCGGEVIAACFSVLQLTRWRLLRWCWVVVLISHWSASSSALSRAPCADMPPARPDDACAAAADTMEVAEMVLHGRVHKSLVSLS
jgi:hypothetical protein